MREFDQALVELSIARKAAEASRDYATLAQAWFIEEKLKNNNLQRKTHKPIGIRTQDLFECRNARF